MSYRKPISIYFDNMKSSFLILVDINSRRNANYKIPFSFITAYLLTFFEISNLNSHNIFLYFSLRLLRLFKHNLFYFLLVAYYA